MAELHRTSAYLPEACRFGFVVCSPRGTRQLPRADPVLPNQQHSQTAIPGPYQVSMQHELAVLTHKEQPVFRAIGAAGMATLWA